MIDGMGVTGVEGVFRRCCEETISVMRANKEALLTIVEVHLIKLHFSIMFTLVKNLFQLLNSFNVNFLAGFHL